MNDETKSPPADDAKEELGLWELLTTDTPPSDAPDATIRVLTHTAGSAWDMK